jgi:flagellar protein FliO/FliZ
VNGVAIIGRMLLALVVVLGIMWCLARWARKPMGGRADGVLAVLARQQLSRNASVAVLRVMDRALVLGVTEQGIRLIAETDLTQVQDVLQAPAVPKLASTAARSISAVRSGATRSGGSRSGSSRSNSTVDSGNAKPLAANVPMAKPASDPVRPAGRSALDGSVLSPKMWRQLVAAARDLTVRR